MAKQAYRHSRAGGNPVDLMIRAWRDNKSFVRYADFLFCWIPACAG